MMKRIMMMAAGFMATGLANGQVILEHAYPGVFQPDEMRIIRIDSADYKYLQLKRNSPGSMVIYNLDHSIYKTLSTPHLVGNLGLEIRHITSTLFDCDSSDIEYMVIAGSVRVTIYNEDGSILFKRDTARIAGEGKGDIVNTPSGTKMLLSINYGNSATEIYTLCGTLNSLMEHPLADDMMMNVYPNPATSFTRVEYKLPEYIAEAELVFTDMNGRELKVMRVDHSFDHVLLSTEALPAGTYIYTIRNGNEQLPGKKLMVIK